MQRSGIFISLHECRLNCNCSLFLNQHNFLTQIRRYGHRLVAACDCLFKLVAWTEQKVLINIDRRSNRPFITFLKCNHPSNHNAFRCSFITKLNNLCRGWITNPHSSMKAGQINAAENGIDYVISNGLSVDWGIDQGCCSMKSWKDLQHTRSR